MEFQRSSFKQFKVTDVSRKKKHLILYDTYRKFVEKCKLKFNIPKEADVFFVSEDDEDAEIDSDILTHCYPDKDLLIMIVETVKVETGDINSQTSDTVTNDAKGSASNFDSEEEKKDTLRSDMGAVCIVENNEIEEWQKVVEGTEMNEHLSKFGLKGIGSVLKNSLDKWRKKPLNIAVTGQSGKGKSSFINAIRGLSEKDPHAAEVDVRECTKIPTPYRHPDPKLDNFIIWDVPGVGTSNFPKKTYIEKISFDKYDCFMVVTAERFTELDLWLMNEVKSRLKRCYVIRAKIDHDMESIKRRSDNQECFNENEAFIELKEKLHGEMVNSVAGESDFLFFMISNHYTNKYDFPKLELQLVKDVPTEKKNAMIFGMAGISKNIVEEKAKLLHERIGKIALLSGVGAVIPIPFASTGIDVAIILEEVLFYRSQFALDDNSLKNLAEMAHVTLDQLKEEVNVETPETLFSSAGLAQYLGKFLVAEATKKIVQYTDPANDTAIRCGASYGVTHGVLTGILEMMKKDTIRILQFVAKKNGGTD